MSTIWQSDRVESSLLIPRHTSVCRCARLQFTVYVNGQEKSRYLPKARGQAALAMRRLSDACGFSVTAWPVIVVLCDGLTIKQDSAGVHVADGSVVVDWLSNRPTLLTSIEVDAIWEQARRSTTWLPAG